MGKYGFSLKHIFAYISLNSVHIRENVAQRKPLCLHILCSVQLIVMNQSRCFLLKYEKTIDCAYILSPYKACTMNIWLKLGMINCFQNSNINKISKFMKHCIGSNKFKCNIVNMSFPVKFAINPYAKIFHWISFIKSFSI